MPTYNHADFIQTALDGILEQTYQNFELIIVNDGSTDRTIEILQNIKDDRIKILEKKHNGVGDSLNLGFFSATGEYETWAASDDLFYPEAIEEMVKILESDPNIDFVYCDCEIGGMDESGLKEIFRVPYNHNILMDWNPITFYDKFNIGIIWLWRKELRIKAGEKFMLDPCEDYEMVTRMIEAGGKFHHYPKMLGWKRSHQECLARKITEDYVNDLIKRMQNKRDNLNQKK